MSDSTTNKVVAILAAYWLRHPAACDTPEGMHRWWLNERTDVSLADVEEALHWMIDKELIEQRLAGARSIYRVRADADSAALRALVGAATPGARP